MSHTSHNAQRRFWGKGSSAHTSILFALADAGDWRPAADAKHEARLQEAAVFSAAQEQALSGCHVRKTGTAETGMVTHTAVS